MKNILIATMLLFVAIGAKAQDIPSPIKWKFDIKKGAVANEYTLYATAEIESGWHVFAPEPGGDGLLIPTSIKIEDNSNIQTENKLQVMGKITTAEMDGVGTVNYVEKVGTFAMPFVAHITTTLKGVLTYQCCNEKMCLPPTDVPFSVEVK
jgi:hypothetical protein